MQDTIVVGVDVGGTSISAGCLINNKLVNQYEAETGADRTVTEIMNTLFEVIDKVMVDNTQAIGIGVPGYLNNQTGEIKLINNIPAFQGLNLKGEIENHYKIPVYINNDANCFALGVYYFGVSSDLKNIVALTLGTGLGGGIVINGRPHSGLFGGAGEFGGLPYLDATFEDYCGSKFFSAKYNTNGKDIFDRAVTGDPRALHILDEFGYHLGKLILTILYTVAPEKVIIGGSIAKASEFFMGGVRRVVQEFPAELIRNNLQIEIASLELPGIHGAAALYLNELDLK